MAQDHDSPRLDQSAVAGQTRSGCDAAISINGRHDVSITGQPKGHIVVPEIAGGFDITRRTCAGAGVVRSVIVPGIARQARIGSAACSVVAVQENYHRISASKCLRVIHVRADINLAVISRRGLTTWEDKVVNLSSKIVFAGGGWKRAN